LYFFIFAYVEKGVYKETPNGLLINKDDSLVIEIDKFLLSQNYHKPEVFIFIRHNRADAFNFKLGFDKFECHRKKCKYIKEGTKNEERLRINSTENYLFLKLAYKTKMQMHVMNVSIENNNTVFASKAMGYPILMIQALREPLIIYEIGFGEFPYSIDSVFFSLFNILVKEI